MRSGQSRLRVRSFRLVRVEFKRRRLLRRLRDGLGLHGGLKLHARHGAVRHQEICDAAKLRVMRPQECGALVVGLLQDRMDLVVDIARDALGIGLRLFIAAADEHLVVGGVGDRPEAAAHAVARDHVARDARGALDVVRRAGRDIVQLQLLRDAPTQKGDDRLIHLVAGKIARIVGREADGHAARRTARDNGDLMHGVLRRQMVHGDGVARLMIGGQLPFMLRNDTAALFRPGNDLDHCILHVLHGDGAAVALRRQQRAFVHQILKIGAGEAGRRLGDGGKIDIVCQRLVLGVDFENVLAAAPVGRADVDLPVEAARAQQRRIENILKKKFQYKEVPGGEEVCRAQLSYYADKILMTEPKETLDKYRHELFEKFEELSKEELIQKMMSYEFGKLLKKYASVADLNLSDEERHDGGRREKRRGERKNEESVTFTTFSVNVGKEDGFTPRDLMTIINENAPRKGLEIGSIRIFGNNTKFEVDVRGINGFMSCFRNVSFNGLPFTLSEVKDRYNRSDRGGERRSSTANNKWRSANRRSDGSSRGRFGEKKKGIESGGRSRKKR